MDLTSSYSRVYSLYGGPFHGPAWCTVNGVDTVAVIGDEPEGPVVLLIDPRLNNLLRVVHLVRGSAVANSLAKCTAIVGTTDQSKLICVVHDIQAGIATIVTFDVAKPEASVRSHTAIFPDAYDETESVQCGDKIVWLLTKADTDAMWFGRTPRSTHELWTSTLTGSNPRRLVSIAPSAIGDMHAPFFNYPHALRKKPGESAVSYLKGGELFLVTIK
jgi:hypothetical protein